MPWGAWVNFTVVIVEQITQVKFWHTCNLFKLYIFGSGIRNKSTLLAKFITKLAQMCYAYANVFVRIKLTCIGVERSRTIQGKFRNEENGINFLP